MFKIMLRGGVCSGCKTPIITPVCVLCLTDEIETWVEKNKVSLIKDFRTQAQRVIDTVRPKQIMKCSVCRSNATCSICPVCFAEDIFNWIAAKDKKLGINFAKDFKKSLQQMSPGRQLFA